MVFEVDSPPLLGSEVLPESVTVDSPLLLGSVVLPESVTVVSPLSRGSMVLQFSVSQLKYKVKKHEHKSFVIVATS